MIHTLLSPLRRLGHATLLCVPLALMTAPAMAQSPFSAAVSVNDSVVTYYEIEQRALFLEVIRAPGNLQEQALEDLVNERLQVAEAVRMGVVAGPEEIEAGVREFAARAELEPGEFIRAMAEEGVAAETIRDFVANGISWRNVVRGRFANRAVITPAEIDDALLLAPRLESARILLAEIVVPFTPQNQDVLRSEMARLAGDLNGQIDRFSEAAGRFSAAGTRENGGVTGWRPLAEVPPALRENLVPLAPGETWGPVSLGPAVAIFQMRGLADGPRGQPPITSVQYATIPLPSRATEEGVAAATALRADIDVCDDLYGQRPGAFEIFDQAPGAIPADIAMALATLDAGEIAFNVTRNEGTVQLAVMMCARNVADPEAGREAVRQQLFTERMSGYADGLLEELRADAMITYTP